MESNNDNYKQGPEQLRKHKFNELENDGHGQPAAKVEQEQHQPPGNLSKKKSEQQENDALENPNWESFTREELIQLVQKQLANQNEAHKQLEAVKKEAEESAKQQAMEMATKMEELKRALLASQQKHLDSAKQAEEFSRLNVQLEEEKAEVHGELGKKLVEIEDMHKKVEEKSEDIAEKAKQIDALLKQFNESTSHQPQMPTEQQMKIQLAKETWFDMLAFVPRHQLGKIVPQIGDRKFASIVQPFLHEYGEISIDHIGIVAPYEEDPNGPQPRVRAWQNKRPLRFEMAEAQMPKNIKNFKFFWLRYFDQSVLTFMQKFKQNGLLDNINFSFDKLSSKDILPTVFCHLLPLVNSIISIKVSESVQLVDLYDSGNSKEFYEMNMKMMEQTQFLSVSYNDPENLHPKTIDLFCRWLYQTARADGKPRVLMFRRDNVDSMPISLFIDRIKRDFLMATNPVTFFIRIILPEYFLLQEGICLENGKTKERLVTKMEEVKVPIPDEDDWEEVVLQISRYPRASTKKWIEEYEKDALNWEFGSDKTIYLTSEMKVGAI